MKRMMWNRSRTRIGCRNREPEALFTGRHGYTGLHIPCEQSIVSKLASQLGRWPRGVVRVKCRRPGPGPFECRT